MSALTPRERIVHEARLCLGTPYRHCGRHPRLGLDCIGLLVHVGARLGLTVHDLASYSRHPDGVTLPRELSRCLEEIPPAEAGPGDVLTFWIRRRDAAQHAAIITEPGPPVSIIHTYSDAGRVTEHGLDPRWAERVCAAYRYPGTEG